MAGKPFDIYQSRQGYVGVTNETHRALLDALAEGPRPFQDLVKETGKSKPTVSLALKELAGQDLVEEHPAPGDRRRRFYAAKGQRIGSSDVPIPQLRDAVKDYVARTAEPAVPLRALLEALVSAKAKPTVYWDQARALGAALAPQMELGLEGGPWIRLARFLERTGLARPLVIDVEGRRLECELATALQGPAAGLGAALAGLIAGAWASHGWPVVSNAQDGRRLRLWESGTGR